MEKPLSWAVHTVRDLPTYASGRAVLIGDAVCPIDSLELWNPRSPVAGSCDDSSSRLWSRTGDRGESPVGLNHYQYALKLRS